MQAATESDPVHYAPVSINDVLSDESDDDLTVDVESDGVEQLSGLCNWRLWTLIVLAVLCASVAAFFVGLNIGSAKRDVNLPIELLLPPATQQRDNPPSSVDNAKAAPPPPPQPITDAGGTVTAVKYPLDDIDGLKARAAYSLNRLSRSASLAVRAVRMSDSSEVDIGFDPLSPSDFDVAALLAFGGTDNAGECGVRVLRWYDQSGNDKHITTADKADNAPCFTLTHLMPALWWKQPRGETDAAGSGNYASVVAESEVGPINVKEKWKWIARVPSVVQGSDIHTGSVAGRWFEFIEFESAPSDSALRRLSDWQRDTYRLGFDERSILRMPSYTLQSAQFPRGWGRHYFAALSNSAKQVVRIGVSGDSISAGSCASNLIQDERGTGWVHLLVRQLLAAGHTDGGSGYVSPTANTRFPSNDGYVDEQMPAKYSDGWEFIYGNGITSIDSCYYEASTADAWFQSYVRGSTISVYHYEGEGYGSFSVEIDGVVHATIDTNRKLDTPQQTRTRYNVSAGAHTVILRIVKAGTVRFFGVDGVNTVGVVVDDMSLPGMPIRFLSSSTESPNPAVSADGGWFELADLMIIMLGVNDASVVTAQQFIEHMTVVVKLYRDAGVRDLLIVLANPGDYDSPYFQGYRKALPAFCAEKSVGFVDLGAVHGSEYRKLAEEGFFQYVKSARDIPCTHPGVPSSSLDDANAVHPSDIGHYNMATTIGQWLLRPKHATSPIVTLT